jgi:hypothetical protein
MMKTALLKLLSLKAAAIAALAVGAGGVALAASNGALPGPFGGHTSSTASPGPGGSQGPDNGHGNAAPSPSMVGLCQAFRAGAGSEHGKALDSPAFQALITAAGGKDKVDAFCSDILGTPAPTGHPAGAGDDHPTGPPDDHPTGAPTSHPGP